MQALMMCASDLVMNHKRVYRHLESRSMAGVMRDHDQRHKSSDRAYGYRARVPAHGSNSILGVRNVHRLYVGYPPYAGSAVQSRLEPRG